MGLSEEEWTNAKEIVEKMIEISYRLVHFKEDKIIGFASCFLFQSNPTSPVYVVTCGHGTADKEVFIETDYRNDENQPLLINAGAFKVVYENTEWGMDIAVSKLTSEIFSKLPPDLQMHIYRHQFEETKPDEAYNFGVKNQFEFMKSGEQLLLTRYISYEIGMELQEQRENVIYFQLARTFQDDEYYEGASGAPICDVYGAITSIVIGRSSCRNYFRAFRLDNFNIEGFLD